MVFNHTAVGSKLSDDPVDEIVFGSGQALPNTNLRHHHPKLFIEILRVVISRVINRELSIPKSSIKHCQF